ncbi:hypothetical protein MP228_012386 [Amoeboaphelidium protococcarum]|nr:hypothetical protein MP228_012386 [Amoeboaphelidium protococcarum]
MPMFQRNSLLNTPRETVALFYSSELVIVSTQQQSHGLTMDNNDKGQLIELLNEKIHRKSLYDLHTHLIGMGNANFWVGQIMSTYLLHSKSVCLPPNLKELTVKELSRRLIRLLKEQLNIDTTIDELLKKLQCTPQAESILDVSVSQDILDLKSGTLWDCMSTLFTDDVVYKYDALAAALGIHSKYSWDAKNQQLQELRVEELLAELEKRFSAALISLEMEFADIMRPYVVLNSREKQFQYIKYGIRNADLVKLISNYNKVHCQSLRSQIRSAFTFLDGDGLQIVDHEHNLLLETKIRSNFTPEFDSRFRLRDCIYEQKLEVLGILLNHVVHNYDKAGVRYVEFSLGIGDCLRQHVWHHLLNNSFSKSQSIKEPINDTSSWDDGDGDDSSTDKDASERSRKRQRTVSNNNSANKMSHAPQEKALSQKPFWRQRLSLYHDKPKDFIMKFLASFNRSTQSVSEYNLDPLIYANYAVHQILQLSDMEVSKLAKAPSSLYPKVFNYVEQLSNVLHDSKSSLRNIILSWVVGFDWVGNEKGAPYCAFVDDRFISVAKYFTQHGVAGKSFGFRIHCGEYIPRSSSIITGQHLQKYYDRHMQITQIVLESMIMKLGIQPAESPQDVCRGLRVGHGIAFLSPSCIAIQEILRRYKIVCELNLTSNQYLLNDFYDSAIMSRSDTIIKNFGKLEIPAILSTDDDGIWDILPCQQHSSHISLAAEYCHAISTSMIVDSQELSQMIETTRKCAFIPE